MKVSDLKIKIISFIGIRRIFLYTLLVGVISGVSVFIPYLTGRFIDSLLDGINAVSMFAALFGFSVLLILLKRFQCIAISKVSRSLELYMQSEVLRKVSRINAFALENANSTELGMKILRDIPNIVSLVKNFYGGLAEAIFGVVFALATVFYSNWIIGIIFLIFLSINAYYIFPYQNGFRKLNNECRLLFDSVFGKIFEVIYVMPFLKSLAAEVPYVKKSDVELSKIADFNCKNSIYEANFSFAISVFLVVGEYSILMISGYLAYRDVIPVGNVVFYHVLFVSTCGVFSNFFRLMPLGGVIMESFSSLEDLYYIKDETVFDSGTFPEISGDIRVENISFSYQNSDVNIIDNLSLLIPKNKIIGIFGVNGSGKTTLAKLLIGYLKPKRGKIFYNNYSISELNLPRFRESVSCVFQETLLISGTIRDNITLCNAKYSDEDIHEALKMSSLEGLISKFPNGIDELVGNEGRKLSGGEMQKLAISRAIIRRPKFLVLDEISNHLDWNTKQEIMQLLVNLKNTMTILVISHDKEILNLCDGIIDIGSEKICL